MLAYYVEWHMRRALAPLATNTMQVADSEATFTLQTQPTLFQQRCSELLGVTPRM